jgi:membrane fusion protein (multidrug efflux system)
MKNPSPTAPIALVPGTSASKAGRRKRWLLASGLTALLVGGGYAAWHLFFAGNSVSTDNAYTAVEVAQITPLVSGPVKQVKVVDAQAVRAGDVLIVLDDTDARIALAQAEAQLERTRQQVRQLLANDINLAGQVDLRGAERHAAQADLAKAQAALDKALLDAKRRRSLVEEGAVSRQDMTDAETRLREAQAAFDQAQARIDVSKAANTAAVGARQANAALIGEIRDRAIDNHPEVLTAAARLAQAHVNRERTVLRAPVDGIVTQRAVEIGQQVSAGTRLATVVPIAQIHVDANFKEGQLREVRPGQRVRLTSDLYGSDVVYDGWIDGVAGGSGSAFAAIPAQNATGNWIKVVQRLPVRIRLNPDQLAKHPLRVGLSMTATVDLDGTTQERRAMTAAQR